MDKFKQCLRICKGNLKRIKKSEIVFGTELVCNDHFVLSDSGTSFGSISGTVCISMDFPAADRSFRKSDVRNSGSSAAFL